MKDISTKVSHKDWLEELALKVEHSKVVASRNQVAKELQEQQKEEIKGSSEEDLQKLEGQVKHYKSVLDEINRLSPAEPRRPNYRNNALPHHSEGSLCHTHWKQYALF